jgi:hypothetical protein
MSYPTLFATPGMRDFAVALDTERQAQLAKWGDQRHPDGTGGPVMRQRADEARAQCQYLAANGGPDWRAILLEEVYEALAEDDPATLRTELVQAAAVIAAWLSDLDRRTRKNVPVHLTPGFRDDLAVLMANGQRASDVIRQAVHHAAEAYRRARDYGDVPHDTAPRITQAVYAGETLPCGHTVGGSGA